MSTHPLAFTGLPRPVPYEIELQQEAWFADLVERVSDPLESMLASPDSGRQPEGEIRTDRHVREEQIVLKQDSHPTFGWREPADVAPSQEDPTPGMECVRKRADEEGEQGRFSGSRRTHDAQYLPRHDLGVQRDEEAITSMDTDLLEDERA